MELRFTVTHAINFCAPSSLPAVVLPSPPPPLNDRLVGAGSGASGVGWKGKWGVDHWLVGVQPTMDKIYMGVKQICLIFAIISFASHLHPKFRPVTPSSIHHGPDPPTGTGAGLEGKWSRLWKVSRVYVGGAGLWEASGVGGVGLGKASGVGGAGLGKVSGVGGAGLWGGWGWTVGWVGLDCGVGGAGLGKVSGVGGAGLWGGWGCTVGWVGLDCGVGGAGLWGGWGWTGEGEWGLK